MRLLYKSLNPPFSFSNSQLPGGRERERIEGRKGRKKEEKKERKKKKCSDGLRCTFVRLKGSEDLIKEKSDLCKIFVAAIVEVGTGSLLFFNLPWFCFFIGHWSLFFQPVMAVLLLP